MQRHQLRELLPAPPGRADPEAQGEASEDAGRQKRPRRSGVIACNACRQKKTACDGGRPCKQCVKRDVECRYRTDYPGEGATSNSLRRALEATEGRLQEHMSVIEQLRTGPEEEAADLLRRLRVADDLPAFLTSAASAKGSVYSTPGVSESNIALAVSPQPGSDLEFELASSHGAAYPQLSPVDVAALTALLRDDLPEEVPLAQGVGPGLWQDPLPMPSTSTMSGIDPSLTGQDHDPRLDGLRIGYWTKVPISDELAAGAISHYLRGGHAVMGLFDADGVMADLVHHRVRLCSTFLVNALLYLACGYTAIDIQAAACVPLFFRELEKLWHAERTTDSLNTVAAIHLFSVGCHLQGKDNLSKELALTGRQMAERLGLIGMANNSTQIQALNIQSPQELASASSVAWGSYNMLSLRAFDYLDQPIYHPPNLPAYARRGSFSVVDGPGSDHRRLTFDSMEGMGVAISNLARLIQETAAVYLDRKDGRHTGSTPLAFAEEKYQKLLNWSDLWTSDMARSEQSRGHVLLFHIICHSQILHIFRPFIVVTAKDPEERLESFASSDSTPQQIFDLSINHLRSMIFTYEAQRKAGNFELSFWLSAGLYPVCQHAMTNHTTDPNWRLWFLLCIAAWRDLYVCFPAYADVLDAHLAMALRDGVITSSDARYLKESFRLMGKHHKTGVSPSLCSITDFGLSMTRPEEARTHALAKKLDDLVMFDEFTLDPRVIAPE